MPRATSSLPLPLSPSMSTGNGARAARAIASRSATPPAIAPIRSLPASCAAAGGPADRGCRAAARPPPARPHAAATPLRARSTHRRRGPAAAERADDLAAEPNRLGCLRGVRFHAAAALAAAASARSASCVIAVPRPAGARDDARRSAPRDDLYGRRAQAFDDTRAQPLERGADRRTRSGSRRRNCCRSFSAWSPRSSSALSSQDGVDASQAAITSIGSRRGRRHRVAAARRRPAARARIGCGDSDARRAAAPRMRRPSSGRCAAAARSQAALAATATPRPVADEQTAQLPGARRQITRRRPVTRSARPPRGPRMPPRPRRDRSPRAACARDSSAHDSTSAGAIAHERLETSTASSCRAGTVEAREPARGRRAGDVGCVVTICGGDERCEARLPLR